MINTLNDFYNEEDIYFYCLNLEQYFISTTNFYILFFSNTATIIWKHIQLISIFSGANG